MKASELITQLQAAIKEHGDLPVVTFDCLDPPNMDPAQSVRVVGSDVASQTAFFISTDP